jgi:hypothetical protein
LQVSCGAPLFLSLLIHADKNFFGRLKSFALEILPTYFAVLLLMKALIMGDDVKEDYLYFTIFDKIFSDLAPSNM